MDRQSLLEQKRQRLQELKSRRLGSSSHDNAQVDQLIEKLTSTKTGISIGIQVDPVNPTENSIDQGRKFDTVLPPAIQKECVTYDKGIQAVPEEEEPEIVSEDATLSSTAEHSKEFEVVQAIDEEELNNVLKESIKIVSKAQQTEIRADIVDYSKRIDYSVQSGTNKEFDIAPYAIHSHIDQVKGRSVLSADFSPHFPELAVVAYSKVNGSVITKERPDLAVVYSLKDSKVFPEFFLHSTSLITTIKFDQVTSNKIIGGLSDGKVVIWNLQHARSTTVPILPQLVSPLFSSMTASTIKASSGITFHHHTLAITSLWQINIDGNDSIASFSLDGVINTWSTNLLASPNQNTIKLTQVKSTNDFTNFRETLRIKKSVLINQVDRKSSINSSATEHQFLNDVIIASDSGKIYHLSSDSKHSYIKFQHQDNRETITQTNTISDIHILPGSAKDVCFITSNMDWTLKIWYPTLESPKIVIPTKSIIMKIAIRPNKCFQFASLGLLNNSNESQSIIEFWDLELKLYKPILVIPLEKDKASASTIQFSQDGTKLLAGFSDGSFTHWPIVDELLHSFLDSQNVDTMDEGISYYIQ